MRFPRLLVAIVLACSVCLAQEICGIPKHGPSADTLAAFEKIQKAVGIEPGRILLYSSSDQLVKDRSGAVSIECPAGGGVERWILYDRDLLKGDALYFALAHETAHHLNSDPISGETPGKEQELRADYFAAQYLTRPPLNWTSQRLAHALIVLPLSKDAKRIYPSIEERRAQVNAGYEAEYALLYPNESGLNAAVESLKQVWDGSITRDGCVFTMKSRDNSQQVVLDARNLKVSERAREMTVGSKPPPTPQDQLPIHWSTKDVWYLELSAPGDCKESSRSSSGLLKTRLYEGEGSKCFTATVRNENYQIQAYNILEDKPGEIRKAALAAFGTITQLCTSQHSPSGN